MYFLCELFSDLFIHTHYFSREEWSFEKEKLQVQVVVCNGY